MQHTKCPGNMSTGSAEEDFEGLFLYTHDTGIADIHVQYRSGANVPLQISIFVFHKFQMPMLAHARYISFS